jgi:gamma-glutamylputrescine oxidase
MEADGLPARWSQNDPFGRGFGSAILQDGDFGLDPVALVSALLANAPGDRLKLFAPAEVFGITESGDALLVEARGVTVRCGQVALCTNAYSPMLTAYFADKIRPVRAQMFVTAPLSRRVLDKLVYTNYGYEYFRQLEDGSFMLGGGRSRHFELEVGYDDHATVWLQNTLEAFREKFFPDVDAPIIRRWGGTMGITPDGLPLVGRLPGVPGTFEAVATPFVPAAPFGALSVPRDASSEIYYAAGFNGHGLGWGMVTADLMLAQMLGDRTDGGLFDVNRFL